MPDTDIKFNASLFGRISRKKLMLDANRPLPKTSVRRLREEFRITHTYHSNAIEGNTLTLQETKLVLTEGITVGGKSLAEHLEAKGNAEGFDRIEEIAYMKSPIDHIIVQEIHEIIMLGLLEDRGCYRTQNVRIIGASKPPPDFSKILRLMDEFFDNINSMIDHPIIIAADLHHKFVAIHPFSDGNGRVARLLTNLLLMQKGYPPIVLKKEDRKKYFDVLRKADQGNLGPFINFLAKAVDESLTLYLAIFGGKDELLPLTELAEATPYSQEYLSLRARQGVLSAVKIGRVWHSTKRALEEYMNEHSHKSVNI